MEADVPNVLDRGVDPIVAPSIDLLHESQSDCSQYGPRPVARAELGEDVGDIVLDRPFGQIEAARDLLVRISSRQQPQNFELTCTEVDLSDFCLRGGCQPRVNRLSGDRGFIDIKKLKGVKDGQPIAVAPLTFESIATAGSRLAKSLEEIIVPF